MVQYASSKFRMPEHPSDNVFLPSLRKDIRNGIPALKGSLMTKVNLIQLRSILNNANGIGLNTSINLSSLADSMLEELSNPSSILGKVFAEEIELIEPNKPSISKQEFINNLPDEIKNDIEFSQFEAALPEQIPDKNSVIDALNSAFDSDYDGIIADAVDYFISAQGQNTQPDRIHSNFIKPEKKLPNEIKNSIFTSGSETATNPNSKPPQPQDPFR